MLKAEFYIIKDGSITGFCISGHSGYSESGTDIVCAAVSSAAYMAANTMTEILNADVDVQVAENLGIMKAFVSERDVSKCHDIIEGLKMHLILLEEMYPDNIKVSYMEV